LKEIVERVVVDQLGYIIRVEWHSPFAYIRHITERTLMELAGDRHETSRTMTAGANCSDWFSACGPEETSVEQSKSLSTIQFLAQVQFPNRKRLLMWTPQSQP
jgi:hypothetical protein